MDLRRRLGSLIVLGLALLPGLSVAAGKCERLVVTGSPDAPPYLWQDPQNPKQLIGASADLLQQVAKDLGIKVELLYAGKRSQALDEVRSGRMDMLADAPLTFNELESLDYILSAVAGKRLSGLDAQRLDAGLQRSQRLARSQRRRCRKSLE
jgi:polar amino acid transport system substrate-binding protein